jgi:hypothetical protein
LTVFPVYGVAYGSLGTAISLLIYLYVSAAVLRNELMAMADSSGLPLAVSLTSASPHEVTLV